MYDSRETHLHAIFRILRYIKYAPRKNLFFSKYDHLKIEAFTDANWIGSLNDKKSTIGYCTLVRSNLITWKSKKQSVVTMSKYSSFQEYNLNAFGRKENGKHPPMGYSSHKYAKGRR